MDAYSLLVLVQQAGAATAATAAQYTGAAVMLYMMARKDLLVPADMGSLPPPKQWADTLKPGIPFAFCIAAVVTALLTATNLATGAPHSLHTFAIRMMTDTYPDIFVILGYPAAVLDSTAHDLC